MTAVHIRIPEIDLYGPFLLWLLGGCAPSLASRVHVVLSASGRADYHRVYACVLSVLAVLGTTCLGSRFVGVPSVELFCLGVVAAVPLAWISFEANLWLMRERRRTADPGHAALSSARALESYAAVRPRKPGRPHVSPTSGVMVARTSARPANAQGGQTLVLVAVAVLEELVFRGLLLELALRAGAWYAALLVTLSVVMFCLGHVHYGFGEAFGKLPLALSTTAITLLTGSCWVACLVHAGFNLKVAQINQDMLERARRLQHG